MLLDLSERGEERGDERGEGMEGGMEGMRGGIDVCVCVCVCVSVYGEGKKINPYKLHEKIRNNMRKRNHMKMKVNSALCKKCDKRKRKRDFKNK